MPRPKLCRRIRSNPNVFFYKPQGIPLRNLKVMELTIEEWEALRLKNVEGLDQTQSAEKMRTSQSTFQRIFTIAQKKISVAIIKGMAIRILKK